MLQRGSRAGSSHTQSPEVLDTIAAAHLRFHSDLSRAIRVSFSHVGSSWVGQSRTLDVGFRVLVPDEDQHNLETRN